MGDNKVLWTSQPVRVPHQTQKCQVKVDGIHVLELRVACEKDHRSAVAVWVDPHLLKADRSIIDPDRRAAEWVLSIGGKVNVDDGTMCEIRERRMLPEHLFRLVSVSLRSNKHVRDAGLAALQKCKYLTWLELDGTPVGDAGLKYLENCTSLTDVNLTDTRVTDIGFAYLAGCKKLKQLHLQSTRVTDVGLAHLKGCSLLAFLNLDYTQVSDAGLCNWETAKTCFDCRSAARGFPTQA